MRMRGLGCCLLQEGRPIAHASLCVTVRGGDIRTFHLRETHMGKPPTAQWS